MLVRPKRPRSGRRSGEMTKLKSGERKKEAHRGSYRRFLRIR